MAGACKLDAENRLLVTCS